MKHIVVFISILLLSGCVIDADVEKEKQMAMKACIDSDGVPIMSVWANIVSDCKYPPKK